MGKRAGILRLLPVRLAAALGAPASAANDRTSVVASLCRYVRFSARMRALLTIAILTVPCAREGATRRSHAASPGAGVGRPCSSTTGTRNPSDSATPAPVRELL